MPITFENKKHKIVRLAVPCYKEMWHPSGYAGGVMDDEGHDLQLDRESIAKWTPIDLKYSNGDVCTGKAF